jgi:hypothetical protein
MAHTSAPIYREVMTVQGGVAGVPPFVKRRRDLFSLLLNIGASKRPPTRPAVRTPRRGSPARLPNVTAQARRAPQRAPRTQFHALGASEGWEGGNQV